MKIDSSTIGMESARSYRASRMTVRHFSITDYRQNLTENGNALNAAVEGENGGVEEQGKQDGKEQKTLTMDEWQDRFNVSTRRVNLRTSASNTFNSIRHRTIRYIFSLLFGGSRSPIRDWMEQNGWTEGGSGGQDTSQDMTQNPGDTLLLGNGNAPSASIKVLNYTEEFYQVEAEDTFFSTVGTVRTSDGREINFNVNVGMSRQFEQYYKSNTQMGTFTMCDPLVINLDTDVAELSDQTFYFDIDGDGELDEISELGRGSGYLALDKNGDGVINDGSELFGTESGNGFADLAKYDEDGNGWIDENDAIWSKLKIWTKDENGNDVLYRLADKGVGAICLQNASTDFTLTGGDGHTKGAVRNTGVFLYENGNVGTVQHVDVAKYSGQA